MNTNEPLGLPRGSVRAILAIGFVGVVMFRVAAGLSVDPQLLYAVYGVMGAYSLLRVTDNPVKPPNEPQP